MTLTQCRISAKWICRKFEISVQKTTPEITLKLVISEVVRFLSPKLMRLRFNNRRIVGQGSKLS